MCALSTVWFPNPNLRNPPKSRDTRACEVEKIDMVGDEYSEELLCHGHSEGNFEAGSIEKESRYRV